MPDPKETTKARLPEAVSAGTKSQILSMIQSHISLAGRMVPVADVDAYSKGDSPGPVDQYSKGSPTSMLDEISNPAELGQKVADLGNIAGKVGGIKE